MNLYLRNKGNQKEKNKLKKKPKLSGHWGHIYISAGIICVLLVVLVAAFYVSDESHAADVWSDYSYVTDDGSVGDMNFGDWEFNKGSGTVLKLSDLVLVGEEDGIPCAAIQTQDQLNAVRSGLKTTMVVNGYTYEREMAVKFKLVTSGLKITDFYFVEEKEDGTYTSEDRNPTVNPYVGQLIFAKDTFDGMGNSIRVECGNTLVSHTVHSWESHDGKQVTGYYEGVLFAGVTDGATICNLKIEVNTIGTREYKIGVVRSCENDGESIDDYIYTVGTGLVCGVADDATFMDIEIANPNNEQIYMHINQSEIKEEHALIQAGAGGIVGCAKEGILVRRCDVELNVSGTVAVNGSSYLAESVNAGGIMGISVAKQETNQVIACHVRKNSAINADYNYISAANYGTACINYAGGIVGGVRCLADDESFGIRIEDCLQPLRNVIGGVIDGSPSGVSSVWSNCYTYSSNSEYRYSYKALEQQSFTDMDILPMTLYRWSAEKSYAQYGISRISNKKERLNTTDWEYDEENNEHYLIHPQSSLSDSHKFTFDDINMSDPGKNDNGEYQIRVDSSISEWAANEDRVTARATLSIQANNDGEASDPIENFRSRDAEDLKEGTTELSASIDYENPSLPLNVKAAVRVVITDNMGTATTSDDMTFTVWSDVKERTYSPTELYIGDMVMKTSQDRENFTLFDESGVYPLGTTWLQLNATGEKADAVDYYYLFAPESGLELGDEYEDVGGTVTLDKDRMMSNVYEDSIILTKDARKNELSNKVYMYVMAYLSEGQNEYYKLFEYDINVYAKDELIRVSPDDGSRVPNGGRVTFEIGNRQVEEYPYDRMRMLVTTEEKEFRTLSGVSGVVTYNEKRGEGTEEAPYYLLAETILNGSPDDVIYIYIEPIVNKEDAPEGSVPYEERYGSFVQEYVYTIMSRASGLEVSPATISVEQTGNATELPINEKVYMSSQGSDDIIIYDVDGKEINPRQISDQDTLSMLENVPATQIGDNAYYLETAENKLYISNNDLWYVVEKTEGMNIYEDGILSFDSSYAGETVLLSTMLFSSGYSHSENVIYKYQIQEQTPVDPPSALLADGSNISMDRILNFHCGQNCLMYYTIDGREPQVIVDSVTGVITVGTGTYLYEQTEGIVVKEDNGFNYGEEITIKIVAYPVQDANANTPVYDNNRKNSESVSFTYEIIEQEQVEAPVAYPETSQEEVKEIAKGDRISLTCATSTADIYYTTDGTTPTVEDKNKYINTIEVTGDYGSYFTVKAIAHKEGMKDSEEVSFLYKVADMESAGEVTATPGTSTSVIKGDKIILSASMSGADIYYTTNGTTPEVKENADGTYTMDSSVKKYNPEKAITVPKGTGSFTVCAVAVKAGMANGSVAEFSYTYAEEVARPYATPSSGEVTENTQIILQSAQEDAIIYYEIAYDGKKASKPTTSSAVFSKDVPIVITRNTQIKAFAYYNRQSSSVVTFNYTLAKKMQEPSPSVGSGSVVPSGTIVSLPVSSGKVYYTTDGSDPMDSSNTAVNVGTEVVITGKPGDVVVIKACTKESGATTSEMVTFTYQISQYAGGVKADVETGSTIDADTVINLTTDVTGGTVYYTTGSGNPVSTGTKGNSVKISGKPGDEVSLKAVAVAPNTKMTGSYAFFDFRLMEQLAAPNASIKSGTKLTKQSSVILKANKGKIYYTIDGKEPSKESNEYTAPIIVSESMTIKAIAIEEGFEDSEINTFKYTMAAKTGDVRASVPEGTVTPGTTISLSCSTNDATIYYTTDGTDPNPEGEEGVFVYDSTEGISIYRSVNLKAIATKADLCNSNVLSINYDVTDVPVQVERERQKAEEEEAGLKPSDTSKLKREKVTDENTEEVLVEDIFSDTSVSGTSATISENTVLRAKKVNTSYEAEKEVKKQFGDNYEFLCNYDFVLYVGGERVQPKGPVEIKIPIPEGYEDADVTIVHVNENDGIEIYETRRENGYAYAQVSHFSKYAIVGAWTDSEEGNGMNLIVLASVIAGIFVLIGIGMIIHINNKKKKYQ